MMMASAPPLGCIDESPRCDICLNHLREPTILPCSHRYCKDCIGIIVETIVPKEGSIIECPKCPVKHVYHGEGTDSRKTPSSIETADHNDRCATCSNELTVVSCSLRCYHQCRTCGGHHEANERPRNHQADSFPSFGVELVKVCVACTHGNQQGHTLKEVYPWTEYVEREMAKKVADLMQYKDKVYQMHENIRTAADELHKQIHEQTCTILEGADDENGEHEIKWTNQPSKDINALLQSAELVVGICDHSDDIVQRFENATTTALSLIGAGCDWVDGQYILDQCHAIDLLIEELGGELIAFERLTAIKVGGLILAATGRGVEVDVTEKAESVVDVSEIEGWTVDGITSNKNGTIVVTGHDPVGRKRSHITVINWRGYILRQDVCMSHRIRPYRSCDFLTGHHITTICEPHEMGVYDIRDGGHRTANYICQFVTDWPGDGDVSDVSCVAADSANDQMLMGRRGSRDVAVFSSDFKYIHTMTLPSEIRWPKDMAIHRNSDSLLVCDSRGGRAYAVTMERSSACKIKYEFMKPNVDEYNWWPSGVCVDRNGFIYMLWAQRRVEANCMCIQYSQVGGTLLTERLLGEGIFAACITAVETKQGEKLVIPTYDGDRIIYYGLVAK